MVAVDRAVHTAKSDRVAGVDILVNSAGIGRYRLHVLVKHGEDTIDWTPNVIERRIIRDALGSVRSRVIHAQLDKVLPT
jgi:NAD(P)-dependent dehydrogenase (short-subunit alcohol dehydrogenase family)